VLGGSVYNTHGLVENYGPEVITLPRFSHYRIKENAFVRSQARGNVSPDVLLVLFSIYDSDRSKIITLEEFQVQYVSPPGSDVETLTDTQSKMLFYLADTDESNGINENEFNEYIQKMVKIEEGFSQSEIWSQDDIFNALFHAYDKNGSGQHSIDEFITYLEEMEASDEEFSSHGSLLSKDYGNKFMFHLADLNSNGYVTKAEHLKLLTWASQYEKGQSILKYWTRKHVNKALFETIDENDNNLVSIDELNKLMLSGGNILSVHELQLFRNLVDMNGDGKITYNEIAKIMDSGCRKWIEDLD